MGLSPSALFHFTSNKEGLIGILRDDFKVKYCFEKFNIDDEPPVEIAIPMVSFCDIKISEIADHVEKYGSYGIGLSKDWAFEKNLNPVLYMNSKSTLFSNYVSSARTLNANDKIDLDIYFKLSNIVRYSKIYEGELKRKGGTKDNYRFADEREWRYVPEINSINNSKFLPWLTNDQYDTNLKREKENHKLNGELLQFDINQILYIIVKNDDEINEIIDCIRSFKGKSCTIHEIEKLTTRILSYERILMDF